MSLASLKNLIDNHRSQIITNVGLSEKQNTGQFDKDRQDIKEPVRNISSTVEITQIKLKIITEKHVIKNKMSNFFLLTLIG